MYDCVMQEVAGLRQQVGFLTSSLHAAEQAQSSAEAAVQEKRQQSAEAKQVNRLTLCVTPPSPSPSPSPFSRWSLSAHVECSLYCWCRSAKCKTLQLPVRLLC